jgi:hypothetical protein
VDLNTCDFRVFCHANIFELAYRNRWVDEEPDEATAGEFHLDTGFVKEELGLDRRHRKLGCESSHPDRQQE